MALAPWAVYPVPVTPSKSSLATTAAQYSGGLLLAVGVPLAVVPLRVGRRYGFVPGTGFAGPFVGS
jgi:hypothetical protein